MTVTPTRTATPTRSSSGLADAFEPDDTCATAAFIATDGMPQRRNLHAYADADWVTFDGNAGVTYRIEVTVPPGSQANVVLELHTHCASNQVAYFDRPYTNGARMDHKAVGNGPLYVRVANTDAAAYGATVTYDFSVRQLRTEPEVGVAIIVTGREKFDDLVQPNIHNIAKAAYTLFVDHHYCPVTRYLMANPAAP